MPEEDLKKFAKNINRHMPKGEYPPERLAHLGRDPNDPNYHNPERATPPAPRPGPPPAPENVQGASESEETDDILEQADHLISRMKENIEIREEHKEFNKMVTKTVPEMLIEASEVYRQRQEIYGYNYLQFGHVMMALFPNGIKIEDADAWNRLGIFVQMITKVTRYASQMNEGGHDDSLLDLSVYSQMLREVDAMIKAGK